MDYLLRWSIILFGIFQALVFGIALLAKKENRLANRFLTVLLFCMGYENFIFIVIGFRLYDQYFWLHLLPYGLAFVYGPAFYFYIYSLTSTSFRFGKKHLWHFAFIALDYVHSIYHLIYGRNFPKSHLQLHAFIDEISNLAVISLLIYTVYGWKLLKNYEKKLPEQLSYTDHMTLRWLKKFLIGMIGMLIISTVYTLAKVIIDFYSQDIYYFQFLPVIVVSWLGVVGIQQRQTMVDEKKTSGKTIPKEKAPVASFQLEHHTALLKQTMEQDRLYLNPELSVRILEEKTQMTAKEISIVLNQGLQKNFYQFVNEYRVQEVKERLLDSKYQHLTILGIGLEAGFKSKATFNRLFKNITGITPKQYRDEHTSQ